MKEKQLIWLGSTKKDLAKLPDIIIDVFGYGLYLAQKGERHVSAKTLQGFSGANVLELRESDQSGTYRAVYCVQMASVVFVLHVFQKKSKEGIKTPQRDIELINNRLQQAQEIYKELLNKKEDYEKK